MLHVNDRSPNFYSKEKFYLVRCFRCDPERGRENWSIAVASGSCAFCGWNEKTDVLDENNTQSKNN